MTSVQGNIENHYFPSLPMNTLGDLFFALGRQENELEAKRRAEMPDPEDFANYFNGAYFPAKLPLRLLIDYAQRQSWSIDETIEKVREGGQLYLEVNQNPRHYLFENEDTISQIVERIPKLWDGNKEALIRLNRKP